MGWGLRPCEGWGLLVPRGLYGWGGFGGSGGENMGIKNLIFISAFVWDLEKEIGFAYVPTYLAW